MATKTSGTSQTPPEDRDRWRTPPELYARLDSRYGPFDLDVAAELGNSLCGGWFFGPGSPLGEDALVATWRAVESLTHAYCNPPYSLTREFVEKAVEQARLGIARTTLLVPATTDVRWWHDRVWNADDRRFRPGVEVEFLRRVRYLRPDGTAAGTPHFGSVVLTFWA